MFRLQQLRTLSFQSFIIGQFRQPRANYIPTKRMIDQNKKLLEEDKKLIEKSSQHLPEFLEEMEESVSQFGQNPAQFEQDRKQEEIRTRRFIKNKIFEKKHFKPMQEVNLLTWEAKEQIRYLHYEFPEEWTLQKLADSFPISVDGLKRLLKSIFVPRDAKALYQHDLKVKKNWLALKQGTADTGGPLAVQYEQLVLQGKVRLLGNAAGNTSFPMPEKKLLFSETEGTTKRKVGRFESIVKDYVEEKKTTENSNLLDSGKQLESDIVNQTSEIRTLLESFVPAGRKKSVVSHTSMFAYLQDKPSLEKEEKLDAIMDKNKMHQKKSCRRLHKFKYSDDFDTGTEKSGSQDFAASDQCQITHGLYELDGERLNYCGKEREKSAEDRSGTQGRMAATEENFSSVRENSQDEFNLADDPVEKVDNKRTPKMRGGRRRGNSRQRLSDIVSDELVKYEMEGTKIVTGEIPRNQDDDRNGCGIADNEAENMNEINVGQFAKSSSDQQDSLITRQMKFENADGVVKDPYLYSDRAGYQHPYGRVDDALHSINCPKDVTKPGRIFKKGKVYYDESGEFLFRTP